MLNERVECREGPVTLDDYAAIGVDMEGVAQSTDALKRARLVRVHPSARQRQWLVKCFGVTRRIYNQCVATDRSGQAATKAELRRRFVNNASIPDDEFYKKDVPNLVRNGAVDDYLRAGAALRAKARYAKASGQTANRWWVMHFRSKKRGEQSILIPRALLKVCGKHVIFVPTMCPDGGKLRIAETLGAEEVGTDCRMVHTKDGRFYLSVTRRQDVYADENQVPYNEDRPRRICAVDPGVRTFQTVYDPCGRRVVHLFKGDIGRITRIAQHMDRLQSEIDSKATKHKKRWRLKRALVRMRRKIQDLQRDAHWKAAGWLTQSFDVVIIPWFDTTQMSARGSRKIRSKTVRAMAGWAHGKFRERLVYKAEQRGTAVVFTTEPYTSKTCGRCGDLNHRLGGSKTFVCGSCRLVIDRDTNGARNIFIRSCSRP